MSTIRVTGIFECSDKRGHGDHPGCGKKRTGARFKALLCQAIDRDKKSGERWPRQGVRDYEFVCEYV